MWLSRCNKSHFGQSYLDLYKQATVFALKQVSLINDLNGSEGAEEQRGTVEKQQGQAWGTALHITTCLCVLQALGEPSQFEDGKMTSALLTEVNQSLGSVDLCPSSMLNSPVLQPPHEHVCPFRLKLPHSTQSQNPIGLAPTLNKARLTIF